MHQLVVGSMFGTQRRINAAIVAKLERTSTYPAGGFTHEPR